MFPYTGDAKRFVGKTDRRKDGHATNGSVMDPKTGLVHQVVIGHNEETCTWKDARGHNYTVRTPEESLWRDAGTEGPHSGNSEAMHRER
jgi:hypothetical protein